MFTADKVSLTELFELSQKMDSAIVKGVVDIKRRIVILDASLHADEEAYLLENGSNQSDLWGFNLLPEQYGSDDFIVYDSMINLRPWDGNRSRFVTDTEVQNKIKQIIAEIVFDD